MSYTIDLGERTALVTGAGQGVGRAICLSMAAAGAKVLVNDFVAERAEAVSRRPAVRRGRARSTFPTTRR